MFAQNKITLLDDFDNLDNWKAIKSDGAEIKISSAEGIKGKCIRIDYNLNMERGTAAFKRN